MESEPGPEVDVATDAAAHEALRMQQLKQLKLLESKMNIDYEPSKDDNYDFIFIVFHGIGTTHALLESAYKTFKYTIESVKRHWFYRQKVKIHLHFTNWKRYIIDAEKTLYDNVSIDTVKDARRVVALALMDILFYFNPRYSDALLKNVANDVNTEISKLRNHPSGKFKNAKLVVIGHSFGTVIMNELLFGVAERASNLPHDERPRLEHKPDYFFGVGSPLACYLIFQNPQILTNRLTLPEYCRFYNVFHPYDPIACRWERLIYRGKVDIPDPVLLPYWQNNGFRNWYDWDRSMQQAKSMIVDNISDVASTISRSIFGWWSQTDNDSILESNVATTSNRKKTFENFRMKLKYPVRLAGVGHGTAAITPDVTEQQQQLDSAPIITSDSDQEGAQTDAELLTDEETAQNSAKAFAKLNSCTSLPVRYDYQLQEDATEHYLNPLAFLQSHTSYWSSKDLGFFVLKTLVNRHERLPITSLLTSVRAKAKLLAQKAADEELRKSFNDLAETAKKKLESINNEDIKQRAEAESGPPFRWNNLVRTTAQEVDTTDYKLADSIHYT